MRQLLFDDVHFSYTKESLRLLVEDKLRRLGLKSPEVKSPISKDPAKGTPLTPSPTDEGDKNERITVVERSTKKIIAGVMAPTKANIYQWIEDHPTFEVFRPSKLQLVVCFMGIMEGSCIGSDIKIYSQSAGQLNCQRLSINTIIN